MYVREYIILIQIKQGLRVIQGRCLDTGQYITGVFIDAVDSGARLQHTLRTLPQTQGVPVHVQLQCERDLEQSFRIGCNVSA